MNKVKKYLVWFIFIVVLSINGEFLMLGFESAFPEYSTSDWECEYDSNSYEFNSTLDLCMPQDISFGIPVFFSVIVTFLLMIMSCFVFVVGGEKIK